MYAIKKNIHKVLAAFLCACLLLSYNPAFGTTGTAWADRNDADELVGNYVSAGSNTDSDVPEGTELTADVNAANSMQITNGEGGSSTIIKAGTYTSALELDCDEGPYFGTIAQFKEAGTYPVYVEATYADGPNKESYNFSWEIWKGDTKLTGNGDDSEWDELLQNPNFFTPWGMNERNVATAAVNLGNLIGGHKSTMFKDDEEYKFVCTVTATNLPDQPSDSRTITVYTVDQDKHESTYGLHRLVNETTGAVTTGNFLKSAWLAAVPQPGVEEPNSSVSQAFADQALDFATEEFGCTYDKINQIDIKTNLSIGETPQVAYSGSYDIWLPIDKDYLRSETNHRGYQKGDTITVMWKDTLGGHLKTSVWLITATVDEDEDPVTHEKRLMARFTYDPAAKKCLGYEDPETKTKVRAETVPETTGTLYPGFFTVLLPGSKLEPGEGQPRWYKVNATVTSADGTGAVVPNNGPWSIPVDTPTGFSIIPTVGDINSNSRYYLNDLYFTTNGDPATRMNLMDPSATIPEGITIDPTHSYVTIGSPLCDRDHYDNEYDFEAYFATDIFTPSGNENDACELNLNVVDEKTLADVDLGMIQVDYQKANNGKVEPAQETKTRGRVFVAKNGQVRMTFFPHGPQDGKTYEIVRVETSLDGTPGSWATASSEGGMLNIHALSNRLYVRAVVGEVENTEQVTYVNVNVKGVGGGSVSPEKAIIAYNSTSHSSITVNMTGNPDYYPCAVSLAIGEDDAVDMRYSNGAKKDNDSWTWNPSSPPEGDVTITVNFEPKSGIRYALGFGTTTNGSVDLLGKTLASGKAYAAGQSLPLLVTPNPGYTVDTITYVTTKDDGTKLPAKTISVNNWVGGVVPFQMPSGDEAGDTVVTVTFKTKETGDPAHDDDGNTIKHALNVYVAGSELVRNAEDYSLGVLNNGAVAPVQIVVGGDGTLGTTNAAVEGYTQADGKVNGTNRGFSASVDDGSNYMLSFAPSTNCVVKKVLVVNYAEVDGNKAASKYVLYNQNIPAFNVMDIRANTDVYVYFDEKDPNSPADNNLPTYEYVKVTTNIDGNGYTKQLPVGVTQVLRNASVTNTFTPANDSEWVSLKWQANGGDEKEAVDVKTEEGKVLPYTLTLPKVQQDTTVNAVFTPEDNGGDDKDDTFKVSKDPKDKDDKPITGKWPEITITDKDENTNPVPTAPSGVDVKKNEPFKIGIEPEEGLEKVELKWEEDKYPNVRPWIKKGDPEAKNPDDKLDHIKFTNDPAITELEGYDPYDPGAGLEFEPAQWIVENLECPITLVPTYTQDPNEQQTGGDENNWTVTMRVGNGVGQITTNWDEKSNPLKIAKPEAGAQPQRLTVKFTGSLGSDGKQYVVDSVDIKRYTGNVLTDVWDNFWELLTGNLNQTMAGAVSAKQVVLPIDANYDITVNFKAENADTTQAQTDAWVAVNTFSDPNKGSITPQGAPAVLLQKTDGAASSQQFIVVPKLDTNGKFFAVTGLTVKYKDAAGKDQEPLQVTAGTNDAKQVITWDGYKNVFTLNAGKLGLAPENLNAVDVEVNYSNTGEWGPGDFFNPNGATMKTVNVLVYRNGVNVAGTPETGGMVAPRGTFQMIQNQTVTGSSAFTSTPVVVAPAAGYEVVRITKNDVPDDTYLSSALEHGYFAVSSEGSATTPTTETIKVFLKQQALSDRSFEVYAYVDPINENADGTWDGAVVPDKPVSMGMNDSFFFNVNPSKYDYGVVKITDQYKLADNTWVDVPKDTPNSTSWERPKNTGSLDGTAPYTDAMYNGGMFPGFTVKKVVVNGQVVDRRIKVTFGDLREYDPNAKDNTDYTTKNADRANLYVNVWGDSQASWNALVNGLSPAASLLGIYAKDTVRYQWTYSLPADDASGGYRVFCVEGNGEPLIGKKTGYSLSDLSSEGTISTTDPKFHWKVGANDKRNSIDIYVKHFTASELNGGASGGSGPDISGWSDDNGYVAWEDSNGDAQISGIQRSYSAAALAENDIDVADRVVNNEIGDEFGTGSLTGEEGGTKPPASVGGNGSTGDSQNGAVGGGVFDGEDGIGQSGSVGGGAFIPIDFYMVPNETYMVDQVYLHNCEVVKDKNGDPVIEVLAPKDVPVSTGQQDERTERIAVKYRLKLADTTKPGYLFATYKGDDDSDKVERWDKDFVAKQEDENNLNHTLSVAVSPKSTVEALVDSTSQIHGKIVNVTNGDPMMALQPKTTSDSANDSYVVTYDTVEVKPGTTDFSVEVGPLIKWNSANPQLSTIYGINEAALTAKGYTVTPVADSTQRTVNISVQGGHGTVTPTPGTHVVAKSKTLPITFAPDTGYVPYRITINGQSVNVTPTSVGWVVPGSSENQTVVVEYAPSSTARTASDEMMEAESYDIGSPMSQEEANVYAADATKPYYYTKYVVSGKANASDFNKPDFKVNIPLTSRIDLADGNFLEYQDPDNITISQTGPWTLSASAGEGGSIAPTNTASVAGSWYGSNTTGPWTIANRSYVSFTVQANDGYVLNSLTRNDVINCLTNGTYTPSNASTGTLTFQMTENTVIRATFVAKTDAEAQRTVTISVQGGHGSTSPAPGTHRVGKWESYSITFLPDSGYVPYRIWVDGVQSYVSPTLVGWSLPGVSSDQTFTVEYALAGTTPSGLDYLVQTGQNAATGLVQTGNNPIVIACVLGVAVLAVLGVWQYRRRQATAARVAKYSVTKRK